MAAPVARLARLRAGTSDAHARMETVPAMVRLLQPNLSPAEYVAVLQHMHGFHAVFEPVVKAGLADFPAAAALLDQTRPRALAADLAWFGATPKPLPLPGPMPGPAALGALYVVEGSGLGGRVIARHLAAGLGVTPGRGGSFYGGLSAESARARWQRLSALLETADLCDPADPAAEDRLVGGAIETFRLLEHWLRQIEIVPNTRARDAAIAA